MAAYLAEEFQLVVFWSHISIEVLRLLLRVPIRCAGEMQANINVADGQKTSVILASEAAMMDQINRAKGEEQTPTSACESCRCSRS